MSTEPTSLAEVTYHADGSRWTLVFVRALAHPRERVWTALTDAGELAAWTPFEPEHDLDRPGKQTLTMIDGEAREPTAGEVLRAEPPRLLEYTWAGDLLRWELEPVEGGTKLTLWHTLEDRDWVPKVSAGWHLCLDVAVALMDGEPTPPIRGEAALQHDSERIAAAYARELGLS